MIYGGFAKLYDSFMDDVDYPAWAGYVSALLKEGETPAKRVFECGCGTGSVSVELKREGYDITSSDLSEKMLAAAAEKARSRGVKMPFIKADMKNFELHRPVDAVIACCDCVNYLTADEDALAFFNASYNALKTGGKLLFDVSSAYKIGTVLKNNCFSDSREDRAYFWTNSYDEKTRLIEMELELFLRADGGLYERFSETHIQRAYTESELASLLKEAGFTNIRVYEALTFASPRGESQRLQFTAEKQ